MHKSLIRESRFSVWSYIFSLKNRFWLVTEHVLQSQRCTWNKSSIQKGLCTCFKSWQIQPWFPKQQTHFEMTMQTTVLSSTRMYHLRQSNNSPILACVEADWLVGWSRSSLWGKETFVWGCSHQRQQNHWCKSKQPGLGLRGRGLESGQIDQDLFAL